MKGLAKGVAGGVAAALTVVALPVSGSAAPTALKAWPDPGAPGPRPTVAIGGVTYPAANPYLALVPDPSTVDWRYWRGFVEQHGARRAASPQAAAAAERQPLIYEELERKAVIGANDRSASAELIAGFGTGPADNNAVRVLGRLATNRVDMDRLARSREDDGAIPLARETGVPGKRLGFTTRGVAGDGPHGSSGSGSGDFDYYRVRVPAGRQLVARVGPTRGSSSAPLVAVWGAKGGLKTFEFPGRSGEAQLSYFVAKAGTYYVMVVGCCSYPEDRFESGSGTGAQEGSEGPYRLSVKVTDTDHDFYAVDLAKGDVLGGTVGGEAARLSVFAPDGRRVFGSEFDASFLYPATTPLPGGGNATVDHVAATTGRYTVEVTHGAGDYRAGLQVYRPGVEQQPAGSVQTIFLDFDGAQANTGIFGGPGVRVLSPLSRFLPRWGLGADQKSALIDQIVATVRENLRRDLARRGTNPDLAVRILNSRDHADPWGQPNVSRVIVGGTVKQSGIATIGVAQSIDPGNFGHEETALVLLDLLSSERRSDYSLNHYLRPRSDRVAFVGRGVGNVVSHEAGHYLGNWHVDQFDDDPNLMDQGGNFAAMFGAGPDGVGGTPDDTDVDYGRNRLNPFEGFTGTEDTLNRTAWALAHG